jgi:acetyl esterase/lipase
MKASDSFAMPARELDELTAASRHPRHLTASAGRALRIGGQHLSRDGTIRAMHTPCAEDPRALRGFWRRFWSAIATACLLSALTATGSPAAGHRRVSLPDLTVSGGSVRVSGGRLSGSFVVRDLAKPAKASSASLAVRVSGKTRVLAAFKVRALSRSASDTVKVAVKVPSGLPPGTRAIQACADSGGRIRERSEHNNCRVVGKLTITAEPGATTPTPAPGPSASPEPTPSAIPPPSSVPTAPVSYTPDTAFTLNSSLTTYWVDVPAAYDRSNATPITLFVWLHGCGGYASGDIYSVSPAASRQYISVAVGGREGACWDVNADTSYVLAAIADVKTHFNINPRRVILGGYSSGGDLAYRVAFYNANSFAGLLIENSSPFRDTGSSSSASLAAAAWKFNVVHLAHLQDTTYGIAGVRTETDAMQNAGFPITRIEVDGGHYDEPGAIENGHAVPGTVADLATYLLPHLTDGWLAPSG